MHEKREIVCPKCLKRYQSIGAFVAHMESPTIKCNISRSVYYDKALAIASGGFLVRAGFHDDGSIRLKDEEPNW